MNNGFETTCRVALPRNRYGARPSPGAATSELRRLLERVRRVLASGLVELADGSHCRLLAAHGTSFELRSPDEQHAFVTDAPDLARFGLPTVGYGPGPWRYQADEFIELDQLLDAPRIYLATALIAGG